LKKEPDYLIVTEFKMMLNIKLTFAAHYLKLIYFVLPDLAAYNY